MLAWLMKISTSDDLPQRMAKDGSDRSQIQTQAKMGGKMGFAAESAADRLLLRIWKRVNDHAFYR